MTSDAAKLTVGASTLAVTEQPWSVYGRVGNWVGYAVSVSGGKAPYTYQWQNRSDDMDWADVLNGSYLKGANAARAIKQADSTATPTRPVATVCGGLSIKTQSQSASAWADEKVTFTVEISGGKSPFIYQWQYSTDGGDTWRIVANSSKYSGSSSATLTVRIDSTDNSGRIYRCKISDAAHAEVYSDSVAAIVRRPTVAG